MFDGNNSVVVKNISVDQVNLVRDRAAVRHDILTQAGANVTMLEVLRCPVSENATSPVFRSDALNAVHSHSCGIPRVINILCEHALVNAYANQICPVTSKIVNEVAREFQFDELAPHARLDFNKTRNTKQISTRSISTITQTHSE